MKEEASALLWHLRGEARLAIIILLSDAGRVFGVDRILHERFPKVRIW